MFCITTSIAGSAICVVVGCTWEVFGAALKETLTTARDHDVKAVISFHVISNVADLHDHAFALCPVPPNLATGNEFQSKHCPQF